jgi:hypothetical protein
MTGSSTNDQSINNSLD